MSNLSSGQPGLFYCQKGFVYTEIKKASGEVEKELVKKQDKDKDIVYYYAKVFEYLKYVSLLTWLGPRLKKYYKNKYSHENIIQVKYAKFIEIWVFAHLIISFMAIIVAVLFEEIKWVNYILMIYGCLRTFEIVITQINILLFDQYRAERNNKPYQITGYRRMVILLIHNFFEIIFWFTVTYLYIMELFTIEHAPGNNIAQALYISFVTMTTFGSPNFNIKDAPSLYIISVQSFIGLVMTLLTFARFLSLLPDVKSINERKRD